MKRTFALILVGALGLPLATASAADPAKPVSRKGLAAMGLAGTKRMSDAEGKTIRGKGTFTFVFGVASAGGHTNIGTVVQIPNGVAQTSMASGGGSFAFTSSVATAH